MSRTKNIILLNSLCCITWFTPFSLTGFYTDFIFSLITLGLNLSYIVSFPLKEKWTVFLKIILTIICSFEVLVMFLVFYLGKLKVQNVTRFSIDNSENHWTYKLVYFNYHSVGCGMGEYWEAKTIKFFPLIEYRYSYDACSHFIIETKYEPSYLP